MRHCSFHNGFAHEGFACAFATGKSRYEATAVGGFALASDAHGAFVPGGEKTGIPLMLVQPSPFSEATNLTHGASS